MVQEDSIENIKIKMNEIHRGGKKVISNYYNNCNSNDKLYVLYGQYTVVFWYDDNGVIRCYYYSIDDEEALEMLKKVPSGVIVDVLVKQDKNLLLPLEKIGFSFLYQLQRFSSVSLSDASQERLGFIRDMYKKENVRVATIYDLDIIYDKMYDIFDIRESHLPSKRQLLEYINKKWMCLYCEEDKIKGFYLFKVANNGQFYGFQIWNGTGPEGYFSLVMKANELHVDYCKSNGIEMEKIPPSYCWVNTRNKKAIRPIKFWGMQYDGLSDYVYEKN